MAAAPQIGVLGTAFARFLSLSVFRQPEKGEDIMSTSFADSEGLLTRPQPSSFTSRYYSRKEESDRCLMLAAGLGLTVVGLASRSLMGTFLAMAGGYLAYQSADCSHRWADVD